MMIGTSMPTFTANFTALERMPAVADPTRNLVLTAAAATPITTTPALPPKTALVKPQTIRLNPINPTVSSFTFTDAVPAADSPEFTADDMQACFSAYTRNRNTAENTCKGEWYPADFAPRPHDKFWCATNAGRVRWLPVRLYDGRAAVTVTPYGSLNQCN